MSVITLKNGSIISISETTISSELAAAETFHLWCALVSLSGSN